jgi:hypothetical protein
VSRCVGDAPCERYVACARQTISTRTASTQAGTTFQAIFSSDNNTRLKSGNRRALRSERRFRAQRSWRSEESRGVERRRFKPRSLQRSLRRTPRREAGLPPQSPGFESPVRREAGLPPL